MLVNPLFEISYDRIGFLLYSAYSQYWASTMQVRLDFQNDVYWFVPAFNYFD